MSKLTKTTIDAARYDGDGMARDVRWDHVVKGLGLRVYPSGRKTFVLSYRTGARKRLMALGAYGVLTLDEARTTAKRKLGNVLDGKDPLREREARLAEATVKELGERWLDDWIAPKRKPLTIADYRFRMARYVYTSLGHLRIGDVTRADVAKLHGSLAGKPRQGNYVLAIASAFFTWTERMGWRAPGSNPARYIERYPEARRERYLTHEEIGRLAKALAAADRDNTETKSAIAAILLTLFTGMRRGEVMTLRWEYVDMGNGMIRLPDAKAGARTVLLNPQAIAILERIERVKGNPWTVTGRRDGGHLEDLEKPWQRIRAAAGLDDVRLHDLRHSFATLGVTSGLGLPIIGKLLGHRVAATTARYAHVAPDPAREANAAIGNMIADAMNGKGAALAALPKPA